MRLWSISKEELQVYPEAHDSGVAFTTFSTDGLYILSACWEVVALWAISSSNNIARFSHSHFSPTNFSPSHVQNLIFDLTAAFTSDGARQSSLAVESVQRHFDHSTQVYFDSTPRTICLSYSPNYSFHLPADFSTSKWKVRGSTIAFGGTNGQVTILDLSNLS